MRPSADPDAIASQCPRSPHAHNGPLMSTVKCPTSAPKLCAPRYIRPSSRKPAADAGAERHEQDVALADCGAVCDLAARGHAGVVVDRDRATRCLRERVAQRRPAHVRQVRRVGEVAVAVDEARGADADRRARRFELLRRSTRPSRPARRARCAARRDVPRAAPCRRRRGARRAPWCRRCRVRWLRPWRPTPLLRRNGSWERRRLPPSIVMCCTRPSRGSRSESARADMPALRLDELIGRIDQGSERAQHLVGGVPQVLDRIAVGAGPSPIAAVAGVGRAIRRTPRRGGRRRSAPRRPTAGRDCRAARSPVGAARPSARARHPCGRAARRRVR